MVQKSGFPNYNNGNPDFCVLFILSSIILFKIFISSDVRLNTSLYEILPLMYHIIVYKFLFIALASDFNDLIYSLISEGVDLRSLKRKNQRDYI